MRAWAVSAVFALLAAPVGAGCSFFRTATPRDSVARSVSPTSSAAQAPDGDVKIVMQTRLLERPAGDEYLTAGLWRETVDPLPHELSARLAVNGLRVGVVSGQLPVELERMAASEASVANAMLRAFRPGQPKVVPVNGPLGSCSAAVRADLGGDPVTKTWTAADCGIALTATPQPDGQLALTIEYQIQHGERAFAYQPTGDGTAFDGRHQRTVDSFRTLAFDLTLRRGDVLLFGSTADPAGTLGHTFFFPTANDRLRQRVLLMQPYTAAPPAARSGTATFTPAGIAAR